MASDPEWKEDPVVEREKLLAARGWETDRDRTGVLRELLGRSLQRVYLWAYAHLRGRDKAVDVTRSALLWASRTLDQVPEGRLLDHWIFEYLATESAARLRLKRSELGPEPCQVLGDDPNGHYLDSYPTCAELRAEFLSYRALPSDEMLVRRSGWDGARPDLERFLQGHFGDEDAQASVTRDPLPHRLQRTSFRSRLKFLVVLGLAAWTVFLWLENRSLRDQLQTGRVVVVEDPRTGPGIDEFPPSFGAIRDLNLVVENDRLTFRWESFPDADGYRVILFSTKRDTLYTRSNVRSPGTIIHQRDLPEFEAGGSYLYKVEAFMRDRLIATSRMATYPPI